MGDRPVPAQVLCPAGGLSEPALKGAYSTRVIQGLRPLEMARREEGGLRGLHSRWSWRLLREKGAPAQVRVENNAKRPPGGTSGSACQRLFSCPEACFRTQGLSGGGDPLCLAGPWDPGPGWAVAGAGSLWA